MSTNDFINGCISGKLDEVITSLNMDCEKPVSALRWSFIYGHENIIRHIYHFYKLDSNLPLKWAVFGGHLSICKYLIEECNANPRAENDAAYVWARRFKWKKISSYLESIKHKFPPDQDFDC